MVSGDGVVVVLLLRTPLVSTCCHLRGPVPLFQLLQQSCPGFAPPFPFWLMGLFPARSDIPALRGLLNAGVWVSSFLSLLVQNDFLLGILKSPV